MYDVIVVGARCAGSPTAMLLARKGYRVLLLDKATFPSDTLSSHYLQECAVARLHRWGLLHRLVATGTPSVPTQTFDVGPFALTSSPPSVGALPGFAPRRRVLDTLLLEAAIEAGVDVREAFTVQEVVWDGAHVAGIRGRARGGATVTERAAVVVGADGMRSFVARSVGAPVYNGKPRRTCNYYSYWSDVPLEGAELYPRENRFLLTVPTNDGLTIVVAIWPLQAFQTVRGDIEQHFLQALELVPTLAARIRQGRRVERFLGSGDLPFFFRTPYGPGWALVGDAGYHKDPITAQGMGDAFRDADLVAEAIDAGLSGRRPLEAALADYERQRNAAAMPMYEFTWQLAGLEPPPPEMQALFGALRGNQAAIDDFFGTLGGTVPLTQFYSDENLGRIMGVGERAA